MSLKFCYRNEIHKVTKLPQDFSALLQSIREVFSTDLPSKLTIQYEDSEGDKVIMHNSEEYKFALDSELSNNKKALKIFLTDATNSNNTSFIARESIELSQLQTDQSVIIKTSTISEHKDVTFALENKEETSAIEEKIPVVEINGIDNIIEKMINNEPKTKSERKLKKKAAKEVAKETIREEFPAMAMMIKQMIQESKSEDSKKSTKRNSGSVHSYVSCDNCGAHPIVGNRFKCTVLDDFDLCEDCEATVNHPYPLIKIRNESQSSHLNKSLNRDAKYQEEVSSKKQHKCTRDRVQPHSEMKNDIHDIMSGLIGSINTSDVRNITSDFFKHLEGKTSMENKSETQPKTTENAEASKPEESKTNNTEARPELGNFFNNLIGQFCGLPSGGNETLASFANVANDLVGNLDNIISSAVPEVTKKAEALLEIFPQEKIEDVYKYISQAPNKTLEELVLEFMTNL